MNEDQIGNSMTTQFSKRVIGYLPAIILPPLLVIWLFYMISESPPRWDDKQNIIYGYNLFHHGSYSLSTKVDSILRPSNYREPLYPLSIAGTFIFSRELRDASFQDVITMGRMQLLLKYVNVFWAAMLFAGYTCVYFSLMRSRTLFLISCFLLFLCHITSVSIFDRLYAEMMVSAIMLWVTYLSVLCQAKRRSYLLWSVLGIFLGLLSLTRAVFLYIAFPYVLVFAILVFWKSFTKRDVFYPAVCMVGALATVMPWMIRNQVYLDDFSIALRGGQVLHVRATKNSMDRNEFWGSFYVYSPPDIREAVGHVLGFGKKDLQKHGRLRRLNRYASDFYEEDIAAVKNAMPSEAVSFIRKSIAEYERLKREYKEAGVVSYEQEAGKAIQKEALEIIAAHPLKHIVMCIPFFYRGIGQITGHTFLDRLAIPLPWFRPLLKLALYLSLFCTLALEVIRRKINITPPMILPLSTIAFYVLLTHNMPRYTEVLMPYFVLCASFLVAQSASGIRSRFHRPRGD